MFDRNMQKLDKLKKTDLVAPATPPRTTIEQWQRLDNRILHWAAQAYALVDKRHSVANLVAAAKTGFVLAEPLANEPDELAAFDEVGDEVVEGGYEGGFADLVPHDIEGGAPDNVGHCAHVHDDMCPVDVLQQSGDREELETMLLDGSTDDAPCAAAVHDVGEACVAPVD